MLQLEVTVALIEEPVPGVLGGQERGGHGFEEKGKGQVSHVLKVGQRLWGSCEEWDPCTVAWWCEQRWRDPGLSGREGSVRLIGLDSRHWVRKDSWHRSKAAKPADGNKHPD